MPRKSAKASPAPSASMELVASSADVAAGGKTPIELPAIPGFLPTVDAEVLTAEDQAALVETLASDDLARFYLTNESEGQRHYQRSLDLFGDKVSIIDIKEELLLKKTSERMRFINPLKLLQRQLYNTLLFVARPNMRTNEVFTVSLEYLSWSVEHSVNGYAYLKQSLEEMQQSLVQVSMGGKWLSTQIIHEVVIDEDTKTLHYKLPPVLQKLYGAPEKYYHVSMRMNARFKSKYAHALYEILLENVWRGETGFIPLQDYRERMGIVTGEYQEFKRLAARAIQFPLQELEELADYCAEVKYKTESRKVVALNFIIRPNPKNMLKIGEEASLSPDTFALLREEFGLNPKQITELTRGFKVERIDEICDVLFYRYILKQKAVKHGFRLFVNALEDTEGKYFLTTREKTELALLKERRQQAAKEAEFAKLQTQNHRSLSERFDERWKTMIDDERQTLWTAFLTAPESAPLRQARKLRAGDPPNVERPFVRASFMAFMGRTGQL
ncbi:replication initiation protein [Paraburkholderia sp. UCT31]|uniref:replication initiation protein n=1 Tax=Paraburkholderia sp. UCT31 TaxID=2615209 RepID=UPI001656334B|nr:replication initiation protein [Paraburkholderia sp. UCT31]MBC8738505.1 replication initiation protein [Paraburkholderia sp. UCT31]